MLFIDEPASPVAPQRALARASLGSFTLTPIDIASILPPPPAAAPAFDAGVAGLGGILSSVTGVLSGVWQSVVAVVQGAWNMIRQSVEWAKNTAYAAAEALKEADRIASALARGRVQRAFNLVHDAAWKLLEDILPAKVFAWGHGLMTGTMAMLRTGKLSAFANAVCADVGATNYLCKAANAVTTVCRVGLQVVQGIGKMVMTVVLLPAMTAVGTAAQLFDKVTLTVGGMLGGTLGSYIQKISVNGLLGNFGLNIYSLMNKVTFGMMEPELAQAQAFSSAVVEGEWGEAFHTGVKLASTYVRAGINVIIMAVGVLLTPFTGGASLMGAISATGVAAAVATYTTLMSSGALPSWYTGLPDQSFSLRTLITNMGQTVVDVAAQFAPGVGSLLTACKAYGLDPVKLGTMAMEGKLSDAAMAAGLGVGRLLGLPLEALAGLNDRLSGYGVTVANLQDGVAGIKTIVANVASQHAGEAVDNVGLGAAFDLLGVDPQKLVVDVDRFTNHFSGTIDTVQLASFAAGNVPGLLGVGQDVQQYVAQAQELVKAAKNPKEVLAALKAGAISYASGSVSQALDLSIAGPLIEAGIDYATLGKADIRSLVVSGVMGEARSRGLTPAALDGLLAAVEPVASGATSFPEALAGAKSLAMLHIGNFAGVQVEKAGVSGLLAQVGVDPVGMKVRDPRLLLGSVAAPALNQAAAASLSTIATRVGAAGLTPEALARAAAAVTSPAAAAASVATSTATSAAGTVVSSVTSTIPGLGSDEPYVEMDGASYLAAIRDQIQAAAADSAGRAYEGVAWSQVTMVAAQDTYTAEPPATEQVGNGLPTDFTGIPDGGRMRELLLVQYQMQEVIAEGASFVAQCNTLIDTHGTCLAPLVDQVDAAYAELRALEAGISASVTIEQAREEVEKARVGLGLMRTKLADVATGGQALADADLALETARSLRASLAAQHAGMETAAAPVAAMNTRLDEIIARVAQLLAHAPTPEVLGAAFRINSIKIEAEGLTAGLAQRQEALALAGSQMDYHLGAASVVCTSGPTASWERNRMAIDARRQHSEACVGIADEVAVAAMTLGTVQSLLQSAEDELMSVEEATAVRLAVEQDLADRFASWTPEAINSATDADLAQWASTAQQAQINADGARAEQFTLLLAAARRLKQSSAEFTAASADMVAQINAEKLRARVEDARVAKAVAEVIAQDKSTWAASVEAVQRSVAASLAATASFLATGWVETSQAAIRAAHAHLTAVADATEARIRAFRMADDQQADLLQGMLDQAVSNRNAYAQRMQDLEDQIRFDLDAVRQLVARRVSVWTGEIIDITGGKAFRATVWLAGIVADSVARGQALLQRDIDIAANDAQRRRRMDANIAAFQAQVNARLQDELKAQGARVQAYAQRLATSVEQPSVSSMLVASLAVAAAGFAYYKARI